MRRRLRHHEDTVPDELIVQQLERFSRPLNEDADLDPLMARIGQARVVLIGEASHGTHEYYDWRARLTKRLIQEQGFNFVSVEGDWPDCYRVNNYVRHRAQAGGSAYKVLHAFDRWPTWMWANQDIVDFTEWLQAFNGGRPERQQVGFYGLDVYSLWDSLHAVVGYLQRTNPSAAAHARNAIQCFEPYGDDPHAYARATVFVPESCEDEVIAMLTDLRARTAALKAADVEQYFNAEQNAVVALNAERYYRTMVRGSAASWNVRDTHMADTLDRLMNLYGDQARGIVWEHNTHVGDARFTDMALAGEVNIGQLARERYGEENVVLVGFGSYRGSVIAATEWDSPMQVMPVPMAQEGSWEELLHRVAPTDRLLVFPPADQLPAELALSRGHRAIGVVYHPAYERFGNFVPTVLARRYDAFLYLDKTKALKPLHMPERHLGEPPETFPWAV